MNIKKILTWVVMSLVVCGVYSYRQAKKNAEVPVEIHRGKLEKMIFAEGKVIPEVEVELSSKVPGKIKMLYVKEGDTAVQGQVVCVLDNGELVAQIASANANLRQAKARLLELKTGARAQELKEALATVKQMEAAYEETKKNLNRQQELFDQHVIPQSQLDIAKMQADMDKERLESVKQRLHLLEEGPKKESILAAQAAVSEAMAGVQLARENFANSVIKSPISGEVIAKYKENGEMVQPGMAIIKIADKSKTYARAEVDESDIGWLKLNQKAIVTSDAYPDKMFPGHVTFISEAIGRREIIPDDPTKISDTKVLDVKVLLDPGHPFKLGMTVDTEIHVFEKDDVILVPKDALVENEGKKIYVRKALDNGGAETMQEIQIGASDDQHAEVLSGLREGDKVYLKKNGNGNGSK